MRKIFLKLIVIVSIFILFLMFITSFIVFNKNSLSLRLFEIMRYEKNRLGGIVVNKTSESVKIVDNNKILILLPGKNSREIGVFDADLIIIETLLFFENHKYSEGFIKLCDLATIKLQNKRGTIIVVPSFSYRYCKFSYRYCKKIEPVGYFPSYKVVLKPANL